MSIFSWHPQADGQCCSYSAASTAKTNRTSRTDLTPAAVHICRIIALSYIIREILLVQASPLTVTPVTVTVLACPKPFINTKKCHCKRGPAYSDTLSLSKQCHCKRGSLYLKGVIYGFLTFWYFQILRTTTKTTSSGTGTPRTPRSAARTLKRLEGTHEAQRLIFSLKNTCLCSEREIYLKL